MKEIILANPVVDRHIHWRNASDLMPKIAPYSIRQFGAGLLMPNTSPYIESIKILEKYRTDVFAVIGNENFHPLFTFYLSPNLSQEDLLMAWALNWINGVKYYPKGGTTNSAGGLEGFDKVRHLLKVMEREGIPLHVHGEVPEVDGEVLDDFYREQRFLEKEMIILVEEFPDLKIILEHITTEESAEFVKKHTNVIATITPQHILFDRRALYNGIEMKDRTFRFTVEGNGTHPDYMCRPILKAGKHVIAIQGALVWQALTGAKKFFLGSDSAPHIKEKKYCDCGACGVYSAPIALELYAMAFEQMGILDHLQVFACEPMPDFYRLPKNLPEKIIKLKLISQIVQKDYEGIVTPFAGLTIPWQVEYN